MKKAATGLLLLATFLVVTVVPCFAGVKGGHGSGGHGKHGSGWHGKHGHHGHKHHGHGFRTSVVLGFGPAYWWWYPYPYWYYPPYYAYPPPPPQEPPVYIEQSTQMPQASPGYWYYCQSASAYYPNVQSCPEAWIKVAPRTE